MKMASVARCGGRRLSSFRLLTHHRHHSLAPSFSTTAIGVDVRQNPPLLYLSKPPLYSQLSTASPPPLPSAPSPSSSTSSTSDPPSASKTRSRWRYSIVAASAIALGVAIRGPEEVKTDLIVLQRFMRTAWTFATIAADFKWTWYVHPETSPTYKEATDSLHQRTANRLLQLARANRGLYVKTGQYMTSMGHALPSAYIYTLRPLQNEAPSMSYDSVQRLLAEEFPSVPFESLFASFDPNPIAAASIAQVHSATLLDGTHVAVKLQYPTLKKEFKSDLLAHYLTLRAVQFLFPRFHLSWMHDEIADNLTKELDFIHEGKNSERGRRKFNDTHNTAVYIPAVYWSHTTKRVLTMEWCDGVKVNDKEGLQRMGISPGAACTTAIEAMSEQIFLHGFVHCDPHPGNIFVRRTPPGTPSSLPYQVIIFDWGLCRQMRESVRINYCNLWTALIMRRDADVIAAVKALGVDSDDDSWELIAMSILMRPYSASAVGFANKISSQDMAALRVTIAGKMDKWVDSFQQMPRELLLVLRNQNYLRSLNWEMGQPCNRFRVMARMALKGKEWRNGEEEVEENMREYGKTWNALRGEDSAGVEVQARKGRVKEWWERVQFEWNLLYADVVRWVGQLMLQWMADPSIKGEMQKMAKTQGEENNPLFGG